MQLLGEGSVCSDLDLPDKSRPHHWSLDRVKNCEQGGSTDVSSRPKMCLQQHGADFYIKSQDAEAHPQGSKVSITLTTSKSDPQLPYSIARTLGVISSPGTLANEVPETPDVKAKAELPRIRHPVPQLAKTMFDTNHVKTTTTTTKTTDDAVANDASMYEPTTEAVSSSYFALPSRVRTGTNVKADKKMPPDADVMGALTSLEPKHPISATAIQLVLETFASAGCRVLDPLFLNTNKGAGKPPALKGLDPQVERLIVPLHHDKAQHWTLAFIDIPSHKTRHFDSLPLKSANRVKRVLEEFATSLDERSNDPWVTTTESFCRQNNSFDCGIYVLVAAIFLMAQQQPPTDLHDCSPWRLIFRAMFQEADPVTPNPEVQLSDKQSSAVAQSLTLLVGDKDKLSLSQFEQYANNAGLALNKDEIAVRARRTSVNHLSSTIDALRCSLADVEAALTKTKLGVDTLEQNLGNYQVICANYNLLMNDRKRLQPALNEERREVEQKLRKTEGLRRSLEQRRRRIRQGLGTAEAISTLSAQKYDAILQSLRDAKEKIGEHRSTTLRVADMLAGLDEKLTRNLEGFAR